MFESDLGWLFHITAIIKDLARFYLIDTVFACLCMSNEVDNLKWLKENTIPALFVFASRYLFKPVIFGLKYQLIPAGF